SLQDDGRKVLGWVSGNVDLKDRPVAILIDGTKREGCKVQDGNVFTWEYKCEKPASVKFTVDTCYLDCAVPEATITVAPAVGKNAPSSFFVVDRTAYRPTQALHFAGFLRRLNADGEFEPIKNADVTVELVSQQKQTKAAKFSLTSDDHGKITSDYVFSDA